MLTVLADLRYAGRRLRARLTYAILAVVTLALGVGGTASTYAVVRGVLFDPLPYAREREIGVFWKKTDWTEEEFLFLRGQVPGFREVALYRLRDVIASEQDEPARLLSSVTASAELFSVLGAPPMFGRTFRPGDDVPGAEPVVVLSFSLWRELGSDSAIVRKRLTFDGAPRTVIGVMPAGFWFPNPGVRVYTPEILTSDSRGWNSTLVGRVAPGLDARAMTAPVTRIVAMLDERFDYPAQWDKTVGARITPVREDLMGAMMPALRATLGAMALILLIACANVGALMLGQLDARSSELAVRSALGATRRRLVQQLVLEAAIIATVAGVLGTALAASSSRLLAGALPLGAWADTAVLDWTVFASAMAIALGAALLTVLMPTVSLWRGDLRRSLGSARLGGLEGRGGRLENVLVVAEVALAMLIASGAALLARSVTNLYAVEPGVRTDGAVVVDLMLDGRVSSQRRLQTITELAAALEALPGVRTVGAAQTLPLRGGGYNMPLLIEGRSDVLGQTTEFRGISPSYFASIGLELRDGRSIEASDVRTTEPVVVINSALARKYFPAENPIGRRLGDGIDGRFTRIVGVVADAAERQLTDPALPVRYVATAQLSWVDETQSLVVRADAGVDEGSLLESVRREIARVAPSVAVLETTTLRRVLDAAVGPVRQVMSLLGLLTALALALGAVGVYGVMSHFATRRRRDWAIRVALGLSAPGVVVQIARHGARLVMMGIAIGVPAASVLARALSSLLYGVRSVDPIAFAVASAGLLCVGVFAALVPAWRASRVDPALTLRAE